MVVRKKMKPVGCYPKTPQGGINDTGEIPSGFPGFKEQQQRRSTVMLTNPRASNCVIQFFRKAHISYTQNTIKKEIVTIYLNQFGVTIMFAPLWSGDPYSKQLWTVYKDKEREYREGGWEVLLIDAKLHGRLCKAPYPSKSQAMMLASALIAIPEFNKETTKQHNVRTLDTFLREYSKR